MKSELARRIVFTLGALLVFRLGSYIPLPGVSTSGSRFSGVSVVLNIRFSIFALWILPYLSAAILIQLLSMVSSKLSAVYLAAVFLIPELLLAYGEAPFYLDGMTVLVVVCTVLDIETQVRGRSLTEPGGVFS
jgi:preprotein translocase subunit SecY